MDISKLDNNNMRHVGWDLTIENNEFYKAYFSHTTLRYISKNVTQNLQGLKSKPIVVTDDAIGHVMSQIYADRLPKIGSIFSRYTIHDDKVVSMFQEMIQRSIELITSTVRDEIEVARNNEKLSVWSTVLGDFNKEGLRGHDQIRVNNKHPKTMQINMNY